MAKGKELIDDDACSPDYLKAYQREYLAILDASQTTIPGHTLKDLYPEFAKLVEKSMPPQKAKLSKYVVAVTGLFATAVMKHLKRAGASSKGVPKPPCINKQHLEELSLAVYLAGPKNDIIDKLVITEACDFAISRGDLVQEPTIDDPTYFPGEEVVWVA